MSAVLAEAVAAEVRAEMGRRNLTHRQVADMLGYSRPAAARRITGEIPWDIAELEVLARALGVAVTKFLPDDAGVVVEPLPQLGRRRGTS